MLRSNALPPLPRLVGDVSSSRVFSSCWGRWQGVGGVCLGWGGKVMCRSQLFERLWLLVSLRRGEGGQGVKGERAGREGG